MPQGVIEISHPDAFKDHFDLTIDPALIDLDKLKERLLLPERYTVEQVRRSKPVYGIQRDCVEILVSSPDIPEAQGEMPNVTPCYFSVTSSDDPKTYTVSLQDILINSVSAIREEDKERKVIIEYNDAIEVKEDARNTQFAGFAKLVMGELLTYFGDFEDMEKIIAERAYDLVEHSVRYHLCGDKYYRSLEEKVKAIPDLTEWPSNP